MQEIARQLAVICGEDRLQVADAAETLSIGQRTARIHGSGDGVGKVVSGLIDTSDALAFGGSPEMCPPKAHSVEGLNSPYGPPEPVVTPAHRSATSFMTRQTPNSPLR